MTSHTTPASCRYHPPGHPSHKRPAPRLSPRRREVSGTEKQHTAAPPAPHEQLQILTCPLPPAALRPQGPAEAAPARPTARHAARRRHGATWRRWRLGCGGPGKWRPRVPKPPGQAGWQQPWLRPAGGRMAGWRLAPEERGAAAGGGRPRTGDPARVGATGRARADSRHLLCSFTSE